MATTTKKKAEPVDHIHAAAIENAERRAQQAENGDAPERAEEEQKQEPLLKLTTALEPRPTVEIDEVNYELKHRREFSIVEQHAMQVEGDEFDSLWERKEQLNSKQRQRLKTVLDAMFDKVLIAPAEVKAKLDDESRRAVVLTFTRAPLLIAEMAAAKTRTEENEPQTWDT